METNLILIPLEILFCYIIILTGEFLYNTLKSRQDKRLLNVYEYLPEEEVSSLKQVFYLIMMVLLGINILYTIIYVDYFYLALFDIILSLFCCMRFDSNGLKNKIFLICLMPLPSITYLLTGNTLFIIFDLLHLFALAYWIKLYYDKLKEYTTSNGLGYAVLLLFSIVIVSLFFTTIVENVSLLDALVMVSNAFTSNGYVVLGNSIAGKINSVVLVWSGYILSGVSCATLTTAILFKYMNKRFDALEEMINEDKKNK